MDERAERNRLPDPVPAAFALPLGFAGLLVVSTVLVAAHGRLGAVAPAALSAGVVGLLAAVAEPLAAAPLAAMGWTTVAGFSHAPYADLHARGTLPAAVALVTAAAAGAASGALARARPAHRRGATLGQVSTHRPAISTRRTLAGLCLAAVVLPALTAVLAAAGGRLALIDDLLLYLVAVIAVTLVGGFWPAVVAAVASSLLLNWYFTPPVHTWTIEAPQNMLALLLFITVAVSVSSLVHVAARRAAEARARSAEADTLLALARTVLAGDDSPQAVLDHLQASFGVRAELVEQVGGRWVRVAGVPADGPARLTLTAGPALALRTYGATPAVAQRVLDGFAAQAGAALDRQRLRIAAAQAESLAAGNQMRNALLAAVGHDLRTPLASVKAAVSTLRQDDVSWSAEDHDELLETIEEGTDRLTSLIANLLDMSRIHSGVVAPRLRPTALHDLTPLLLRGLDPAQAESLRVETPPDLPRLVADPGLLERALANLLANALRYSPPGRPPTLSASASRGSVQIRVIDHGPGVPDADRERIFAPFQQAGDRHAGAGVGLGLAVARGFVEAMGGRLIAGPTPGGGLTMLVDLPAVADRRANAPLEPSP